MLIDTHCHIHDSDFELDAGVCLRNAREVGVDKIICVGTDINSSILAVNFADNHDNVYASVGVHPHESIHGIEKLTEIIASSNKIVAIGEIGLDYHYDHSSRDKQVEIFKSQVEIAIASSLPIIFHVREAFDDFWPIIDEIDPEHTKIRGVIHSFTDNLENADQAIKRGLYIGVNGFCTFTKNREQIEMFKNLPLDKILLETDAPYLTPMPFRGKINEPALVRRVAEYLSDLRQIPLEELADTTSANANSLFNLR